MKNQTNKFGLSRETILYILTNMDIEYTREVSPIKVRGQIFNIPSYPFITGALEVPYSNAPVNIEISIWFEKRSEEQIPNYFNLDIGPYIGIRPTDHILIDIKTTSLFYFYMDKYDENRNNWKSWFI